MSTSTSPSFSRKLLPVVSASFLAFCLLLPTLVTAAPPGDSSGDWLGDRLVAKIAVAEPAVRAELARELDLWAVDPHAGTVTAPLTAGEYGELLAAGFAVEIDWQLTAELHRPRLRLPGQEEGIAGYPCYRTVEETYADLAQLAAENPDLAEWIDVGDSWIKTEGPGPGYDVRALVLTHRNTPGPKPPFVLIAAMHARELTTAELATRFAELLVDGYGTDADATWILDHLEVHVVPHLNPDGRKQAESGAFWRKNADNDFCSNTSDRGIDLNRNSSWFWGEDGSSDFACSETFRGPSEASEPETTAIEDYMATVFVDQRGPDPTDPAPDDASGLFISLHSYGSLVLYPWEGIDSPAPNATQLRTLGRKLGFYNGYSVCQTCLYPAAGTTVDQAYGEYGVAAYTFELGTWFFESCNAFESTVYPHNLDALLYAAKAARQPYLEPLGPEVVDVALASPTVLQGETAVLYATADDTRYDSNDYGTEPTQPIAAAGYSLDAPPWQAPLEAMAPADGAFDAPAEDVVAAIPTADLAPGRYTLFVAGTDADGNRGVPTAVFLDVVESDAIFLDGFESGNTAAWSGQTGG